MALDVGELYERYRDVVYRRCLALLRHPDDAAEAVQEVFERALWGLGRFRLQAEPLTWLYAIATRHCLQQLRNRNTRNSKLPLLSVELPPQDAAKDLATRTDLERTLERLPQSDQELAIYFFRDGLTQEEISEVTRVSRKTIGKRLRKLAERLSIALDAKGDGTVMLPLSEEPAVEGDAKLPEAPQRVQ